MTSRMDCCNSLLYGTSKVSLKGLQIPQNDPAIGSSCAFHAWLMPHPSGGACIGCQSATGYKILLLAMPCLEQLVHTFAGRYQREIVVLVAAICNTFLNRNFTFQAAAVFVWNQLPEAIKLCMWLSGLIQILLKKKTKTKTKTKKPPPVPYCFEIETANIYKNHVLYSRLL